MLTVWDSGRPLMARQMPPDSCLCLQIPLRRLCLQMYLDDSQMPPDALHMLPHASQVADASQMPPAPDASHMLPDACRCVPGSR
jgi:hypothetical protein